MENRTTVSIPWDLDTIDPRFPLYFFFPRSSDRIRSFYGVINMFYGIGECSWYEIIWGNCCLRSFDDVWRCLRMSRWDILNGCGWSLVIMNFESDVTHGEKCCLRLFDDVWTRLERNVSTRFFFFFFLPRKRSMFNNYEFLKEESVRSFRRMLKLKFLL